MFPAFGLWLGATILGGMAGVGIFLGSLRCRDQDPPWSKLLTGIRGGLVRPVCFPLVSLVWLCSGLFWPDWGFGLATGVFLTATAAALVDALLAFPSLLRGWTPYDEPPGKPAGGVHGHGCLFDVFLSYKVQDEGLVRPIADWLIASGYRPWFDEYLILLPDRDQFDRAIEAGLANSEWGFLFTRDLYFQSPWTVRELRGLLRNCHRKGHLNLLPIEVEPTSTPIDVELQRPLAALAPLVYEQDAERLGRAIAARFPRPLLPFPLLRPPSESVWFEDRLGGWRVDSRGWQLKDRRGEHLGDIRSREATKLGPIFGHTFPDGIGGLLNINTGPSTSERFERLNHLGSVVDHREMQTLMAELARYYEKQLRARCKGVHLFYLDAYPRVPQVGFTFWMLGHWVRFSTVVLPDHSGNHLEFCFHFDLLKGSFRDYCRYTTEVDRLIRSLTWDWSHPSIRK